ncbi:unnamed protein product [Rotaria sp. Silwood2]|nr:unnamed protein product [Rotaria sp. Silwood2]
MKIIFDHNHLHDINYPCVVQQFINHDGILMKAYLLGDISSNGNNNFRIVYRNSVNNFTETTSNETISFTTKELSHSASVNVNDSSFHGLNVDEMKIRHICESIQRKFKLNLMGIDIIIDCKTKDYAVIDVNYFPGYNALNNVNEQLLNMCLKLFELQIEKNTLKQNDLNVSMVIFYKSSEFLVTSSENP